MKATYKELEAKFNKFHAENPQVYEELVKLTRKVKSMDKDKISIETLYNQLRWFNYINTKGDKEFRLNNNHKSFYARKIMQENPDLASMFNTKVSKDGWATHYQTVATFEPKEYKPVTLL